MSQLLEVLNELSQPPVNEDAAFTWGDMKWIMERIKKAVEIDEDNAS